MIVGDCKYMKMKNEFYVISQFWMFDTGTELHVIGVRKHVTMSVLTEINFRKKAKFV